VQRHPFIWGIILIFAVVGCATPDDVRRVRGEFDYKLRQSEERIAGAEQATAALKTEIAGMRSEILAKNDESITSLRGSLADSRTERTEIRDSIQQLRGLIDGLRRDLTATASRTTKRDEDEKGQRDKLDAKLETLTFKINFIENFLGIGKKDEPADAVVADKNGKAPGSVSAQSPAAKGKTDKESLYAAAYELFREAKYDKSREGFENFLKLYPDTEFSDNAQFWIGECYYFEKKYEKAIVEYEKVTKNFPNGNKTSNAILKQGLAFLKLGDKASARLLLQQVIKDYPNTSQARIARSNLLQIK
jgi:tol-pal system protein YbgF